VLKKDNRYGLSGAVIFSSSAKYASASSREIPHMSIDGRKLSHTCGRWGVSKMAHCNRAVRCTQAVPAGLPRGIPGIGEEIDRAMQQAPHPGLQFMNP